MTNGKFPVPQATIEAGLLHACLNTQQWLEMEIFEEADFTSHRDIFKFYQEHLRQYGNLPSQNIITSRFNWQPPIGEFRYWFTEMKRYSMARKILEAITSGYEQVSDPDKALSSLLTKLSVIRSEQSNHVQATDASANERLEKFDNRTNLVYQSQNMIGIRTGLKIIDDTLVGYTPGSLVGVYARPGLGKTWWLFWSGVNAWIDGHTVLAITPEMPANMANLRIDVLIAAALGKPIDYNKLLTGDPSIRNEYANVISTENKSSRWWTYDSIDGHTISLGDIAALINQHQPDIVLIDGISLLRHESRGQTWEQMKDLCYGMKNLATIREVPILMTHQAVNSARGSRKEVESMGRGDDFHMPSLNDAAFGDAFVQACSDVITMCAEPTSKHINWYSIRKHRERGWQKDLETRYGMAVDYGLGKIFDLSEYGYSPNLVGQETQHLLGKR
jgi:replicative DNA helicase